MNICAPVGLPVVEPAAVRDNRGNIIRAMVTRALFAGPKTVRELAAAVNTAPYQTPRRCAPGCGGHVAEVEWRQPGEAEVRRVLARLEREGRATRFVCDWMAHLWAVVTPAAEVDTQPAEAKDAPHRV